MKFSHMGWLNTPAGGRSRRAGFRVAAGCWCLCALAVVLPGCSGSEYIVVRDHIHALRQDAASMTVLLRDSTRIWLPPWCHHYCATPDSLRAYMDSDEGRSSELDERDIARMTVTEGASAALRPRADAPGTEQKPAHDESYLWGKGKKYVHERATAPWSGRIPASAVRSVSLDPERYLPVKQFRKQMSGTYRATLRNGEELLVSSAWFGSDSSVIFLAGQSGTLKVATRDIAEMTTHRGTLETVGIKTGAILLGGAALGFITGAAIFALVHDGSKENSTAVASFLVGTPIGIILGGIIGAVAVGGADTYSFPP
jgi:hypothetical protein